MIAYYEDNIMCVLTCSDKVYLNYLLMSLNFMSSGIDYLSCIWPTLLGILDLNALQLCTL